jgi:ABC-type multidrug transport system fused ATPase/permease subunit
LFKYISKLLYIIQDGKLKLLFLLAIFLLTSVLEAFGIGLIGPFLNLAKNPDMVYQISILSKLYNLLGLRTSQEFVAAIGLFIVVVFCIKSIAYFGSKWYIYKFSFDQKGDLIGKIFDGYLHLPYEFFLSRNTASIIKNTVIETNHFMVLCLRPLLQATSNFVITLALLILLATQDLVLLFVSLIVLLPIFLVFNILGARFNRWGKIISETQHEIVRTINHGLGGFKETRIIGCEGYFQKQINVQTFQHARAGSLFQSAQFLPRISIEAVLVIFLVLFISISLLYSQRNFDELISTLGVFAIAESKGVKLK